jgi:cyclopropane fatty-acyl-phospholipid synthase-like methyltransferase
MGGENGAVERARRRALRAGRKLAFKLRTRGRSRHGLVGLPYLAQMQRRFQFRFLTSQGLRAEHRLLDIGCGTLRGGIPLIEYLQTGNYIGIEARPKVLEEGRRELLEAGLEHKQPLLIATADPSEVTLDAPLDFAWAFMVLIHMPDEVVQSYLGFVARAMTEDGALFANVMVGEQAPKEWVGFPVISRPLSLYERWAHEQGLAVESLGTLASLGHHGGVDGDDTVMLRFTKSA